MMVQAEGYIQWLNLGFKLRGYGKGWLGVRVWVRIRRDWVKVRGQG